MFRLRSLIAALAVLALTAGVATAHLMPTASADGLTTAGAASGKSVPMGVDGSLADRAAQKDGDSADTADSSESPPAGTHGADVSAAAQAPTPTDGGWANHGEYVSSVARGEGQQTADAHRQSAPSGDANPAPMDTFNPNVPLRP